MLREMCGSKREEIAGEWRRLHSEELLDLYYSQIYFERLNEEE
jgi:hypothetical protein